jgi:hypothetical protein
MPGIISSLGNEFPDIALIIGEEVSQFVHLEERISALRQAWRNSCIEIVIAASENIIRIYSTPIQNRSVYCTIHHRIRNT